MNVRQHLISWKLRPRIVHQLPGRLRVHIPVLLDVSQEFQRKADPLIELFSLPEGIQSVSINFISGNLLIHYDYQITSEQRVFDWIHQLRYLTIEIIQGLATIKNGRLPVVTERLMKYVDQVIRSNIVINKELKIPQDVWT